MNSEQVDPDLPLLLPRGGVDKAVYGPISEFVGYINFLGDHGVLEENMPPEWYDLYALDFYVVQVQNGGNSQFILNARHLLFMQLDRAKRAAGMLGLPELVALIDSCRAWCEANPRARARQDGFENSADALEALDDRLFAYEFEKAQAGAGDAVVEDPAYAAFVAAQPADIQDWIARAYEGDYTARSKYMLAASIWVLRNPKTEILDDDALATRRAEVLAKPDYARRAAHAHLTASYALMPGENYALVHQAFETWRAQDGAALVPQHRIIDLIPRKENVALDLWAVKGGKVVCAIRQGEVTFHHPRNSMLVAVKKAINVARHYLGTMDAYALEEFLRREDHPIPGKALHRVSVDPMLHNLFVDLFVPEALFNWAETAFIRRRFVHGTLFELDAKAPQLVWHFGSSHGHTEVTANATGVRFTVKEKDMDQFYPREQLEALRARVFGAG